MDKCYLAIDIGASSGRHILGYVDRGKIITEEIYRFKNQLESINGYLSWDINYLFREIINGLKRCKELNKIPYSVGIDTWGVDFVLLDKNNELIGTAIAYRDKRTVNMDNRVYQIVSANDLYKRTGIQKQIFNTIYQLMSLKTNKLNYLKNASDLLMIPDYFNYLLTGKKIQEYTNASTTNLLNLKTNNWDYELIDMLGFPKDIFNEIKTPGFMIGNLLPEVQEKVGFNTKVFLVASHDTGSAVMAVPSSDDHPLYISSGTWSLIGTENYEPNNSDNSKIYNFTNEGGYDYRYRYLKNIMGLWMIQEVKREIAKDIDFSILCDLASKSNIKSIVDCNDNRFLSPKSMVNEIKEFCKSTNQKIPETVGDIANVVYNSLAMYYADTLKEIEKVTSRKYKELYIIGGGSNADYLNKLTAKACGIKVYAGPSEATAIGNIGCQMLASNEFKNLKEVRKSIKDSFDIKEY